MHRLVNAQMYSSGSNAILEDRFHPIQRKATHTHTHHVQMQSTQTHNKEPFIKQGATAPSGAKTESSLFSLVKEAAPLPVVRPDASS